MSLTFEQILKLLLRGVFITYTSTMVLVTLVGTISNKIVSLSYYLGQKLAVETGLFEAITWIDNSGYLAFANSILPITEAWALLIFLIPYATAITVYRFVKSWIPTIAN